MSKTGAIVIPSKKCMNTCLFCSGSNPNYNPNHSDFYSKLLGDVDYHADTGVVFYELTGNDPGQYEKIVDLTKYIKSKGAKNIQLSTHGRTLKNKELVKQLADAGIDYCRIPLYSHLSNTHNRIVQVDHTAAPGNALTEATEGIANCTENEIKICGHTVLTQYNKRDINNVIKLYLDITKGNMKEMIISLIYISVLSRTYTGNWFLPLKYAKPHIKEIVYNHPPIPEHITFGLIDYPYCIIEEYSSLIQNTNEYPNIGRDSVNKLLASKMSDKIPQYRIKKHFDECVKCSLSEKCGGITENEILMFGTKGLKAIK